MSNNIAIKDMISAALDGQPVAFKDHFNAAIMDRVYDAVQNKRTEVASTLFNREQEVDTDAETVTTGEEDAQDA